MRTGNAPYVCTNVYVCLISSSQRERVLDTPHVVRIFFMIVGTCGVVQSPHGER